MIIMANHKYIFYIKRSFIQDKPITIDAFTEVKTEDGELNEVALMVRHMKLRQRFNPEIDGPFCTESNIDIDSVMLENIINEKSINELHVFFKKSRVEI